MSPELRNGIAPEYLAAFIVLSCPLPPHRAFPSESARIDAFLFLLHAQALSHAPLLLPCRWALAPPTFSFLAAGVDPSCPPPSSLVPDPPLLLPCGWRRWPPPLLSLASATLLTMDLLCRRGPAREALATPYLFPADVDPTSAAPRLHLQILGHAAPLLAGEASTVFFSPASVAPAGYSSFTPPAWYPLVPLLHVLSSPSRPQVAQLLSVAGMAPASAAPLLHPRQCPSAPPTSRLALLPCAMYMSIFNFAVWISKHESIFATLLQFRF